MVMIIGESGSGKSALALEFQKRMIGNNHNCLWCSGKFDGGGDPYDAIAAAVSNLIERYRDNNKLMEEWRGKIGKTLGEETDILLELVPSLAGLLYGADLNEQQHVLSQQQPQPVEKSNDRSITENATRVQYVFVEFLRLLATEEHPITLLLDDIQWASTAAIALIDALLADHSIQHFLILVTCRQEYIVVTSSGVVDGDWDDDDDDASQTNRNSKMNNGPAREQQQERIPFPQSPPTTTITTTTTTRRASLKSAVVSPLLQLLSRHSAIIHQLVIGGLNTAGVKFIIDTLLRIDNDSDETKLLADIVRHKSDGNPFFVLQLMTLLVDQQLLTYDSGAFRWTWVEGDIQAAQVATNVADAVQKRLRTLSLKDRWILQVASCLGARFEITALEFVLTGIVEKYRDWGDDIVGEEKPEIQEDANTATPELQSQLDYLDEIGILER